MPHTSLSDQDYQRLADTLARFQPQQAMNLEQLDGFFTALLAGPEAIKPSECLPLILGAAFDDEAAFPSEKALEKFVKLLTGHWLDVAHALDGGECQPWLDADAEGEVRGNDWAEGFMSGMELLNDDWGLLFDDAEHAGCLEPILALAFERHPDPEMRPFVEAVSPEQRQIWLASLSPAVHAIHAFFARIRSELEQEEAELEKTPPR
ncbi:YecA family protein [Xenophilus sp. AP218F]|nr:UPF0149 family protein [Chromobacterium sp. ASV5]OWY39437.1 YecA family protein [Xenophilus sp. AP218F]